MPTRVTSKGQVTIPKRIRDAVGLTEGTNVEFSVEGGRAFLEPVCKSCMESLAGSLSAYAKKRGKIDQKTLMNQVHERVAKDGAKEATSTRIGKPQGKLAPRHKRHPQVRARR